MDAESALSDALAQLGLEARRGTSRAAHGSPGIDLVIDPDGLNLTVDVTMRSLVTHDVARRLLAQRPTASRQFVVVADRVTAEARQELTSSGAGYLDLRGRLAIRSPTLVIDSDIEPMIERQPRSVAVAGQAGLEIGVHLLLNPHESTGVREVARRTGRAPSTVSEVLALLRHEGLIDGMNAVEGTGLFWKVAERWSGRRVPIATAPSAIGPTVEPLRLGLDLAESLTGWALTDSVAAAAYGAPVALRGDSPPDFFVPDASVLRRARTLLGTASTAAETAVTLRVAPVSAVVEQRVRLAGSDWPLAHPLFVALDLAQDHGRGHEVLEAWTPETRWPRVW